MWNKPIMRNRWLRWAGAFALWTAIGLSFAGQLYLSRSKIDAPVSWTFAMGRALADWYVFAPNGGQSWIVAMGPISGNTAVLQAAQAVGPGGQFPPNFNPARVNAEAWGTITITFTDCNNGQVSWQPAAAGYTSGSMPITRLTMPAGLSCQ